MARANTEQIEGLQVLRAVAVLLVAWLHSGQMLGDWRVIELPHFGAFGIDIFFVISGFIMSVILRSERGAWKFLKRRLIRIFPIYWVFAVLESLRLMHGHGFFLQNYFPSFLLLPGLYPRYPLILSFSWTMVFEMFFYYSLAAILLFTKKAVPVAIVLFGVAVLLGSGATGLWVILSSPLLLEFIFGAVTALAFVRFGQQRRLGIGLLMLGSVFSLYLRAYPLQGGAAGMGMVVSSVGAMRHALTWGLAAALIVSGVVLWSPVIRSLPGRVAVALGNSSYSAYLASALVIELVSRIRFGQATVGKEILFQAVMVICVFGAGWVSYRFVEWPMIQWLRAAR